MLVDANIFIFASDKGYPEHADAVTFFETSSGKLEFNTIVALECHYGCLRNLGASEAERILKTMLESRMLSFYDIEREDILEGAAMAVRHGMKSNDATMVASMLRKGIRTIATDNVKDFRPHPDIEVINPIRRKG